jgi:septal ring factor EnvC (AmiA/AmiB activator)
MADSTSDGGGVVGGGGVGAGVDYPLGILTEAQAIEHHGLGLQEILLEEIDLHEISSQVLQEIDLIQEKQQKLEQKLEEKQEKQEEEEKLEEKQQGKKQEGKYKDGEIKRLPQHTPCPLASDQRKADAARAWPLRAAAGIDSAAGGLSATESGLLQEQVLDALAEQVGALRSENHGLKQR